MLKAQEKFGSGNVLRAVTVPNCLNFKEAQTEKNKQENWSAIL